MSHRTPSQRRRDRRRVATYEANVSLRDVYQSDARDRRFEKAMRGLYALSLKQNGYGNGDALEIAGASVANGREKWDYNRRYVSVLPIIRGDGYDGGFQAYCILVKRTFDEAGAPVRIKIQVGLLDFVRAARAWSATQIESAGTIAPRDNEAAGGSHTSVT